MKKRVVVPPGGFLSIAGLPPASAGFGGVRPKGNIGPGMSSASVSTSRPRKKRASSKSKRRSWAAKPGRGARRSKRAARLVKGSAAARRYMAKIRRMRKRK